MNEPVNTINKSFIRKTNAEKESILEYGKIPPHNRDMEMTILAAIMLENSAFAEVTEIIKTEQAFYLDTHQRIFKAMRLLAAQNEPIDLLTVVTQLKKTNELDFCGGPAGIANISNNIGSSGNIEYYARYIMECYLRRQLIYLATKTIQDCYDETADVFELLNKSGDQIEEINLSLTGQSNITWSDRVYHAADKLKAAANSGTYLTGIPTYSAQLDRNLMGWQDTDLVIVGARPAMGKTSVALHIAKKEALHGIPVGFFSLEMNDAQLINKILSSETKIDLKIIRRGGLTHDQWTNFDIHTIRIAELPFYMNDTGGLGINEIRAIAKNWVRKFGVKVIYIDYLQLITTGDTGIRFGNREQEISHISRSLKALAKNLNIPIIVLSQLSRECEKRHGFAKRPELSDLRDGGAIEQDADVVIFPFRPHYYGLETDEEGTQFPKGYLELCLKKFRNGKPGTARWIFYENISFFEDYEPDEPGKIQEETGPF